MKEFSYISIVFLVKFYSFTEYFIKKERTNLEGF